jgi:release factor glutamine methyltransferase
MLAETQPGTNTVEALLRAGVRLLADSSPSPRLDAELLLAHATGRSRTALFTGRLDTVAPPAADSYLAHLRERRAGRPVAQITGRREFWSLDLVVTPAVLTPRPETELLVERALARLPDGAAARVLDLGTGSGAVALALAVERPSCELVATDASAATLDVARRNAVRLGLDRVRFSAGDWFGAVALKPFDVVVSNPPYIADDEWPQTDAALGFEPRAALAAGPEGLDALRVIVAGAPAYLHRGGWLLLEHGARQGRAVAGLMAAAGFDSIATSPDLAGLPRVTEGRWSGNP